MKNQWLFVSKISYNDFIIFRMQSNDVFIILTNLSNDLTKKSRLKMKINCRYVCVIFKKYNLIESFSIMTTMHKIKRWFIRWMIDDWMKIWFFLNRCTFELLIAIFNMFFSCFHFLFHLRNVRWKHKCLIIHCVRWRIRKFFF